MFEGMLLSPQQFQRQTDFCAFDIEWTQQCSKGVMWQILGYSCFLILFIWCIETLVWFVQGLFGTSEEMSAAEPLWPLAAERGKKVAGTKDGARYAVFSQKLKKLLKYVEIC